MSGSSVQGIAPFEEFDRIEEDGVEYLSHDVVAQREGVYAYPDPSGGIRKEFISADELNSSIEGVEEEKVVLRHPKTPDGNPTMTTHPRANYSVVGVWKDLRTTRDEKGIAGKVLIRANEVGKHDGDLREYVNEVERHGIGEVSTGYNVQSAEHSPGRHNGIQYDYVQHGPQLDHLALLIDEPGDCSTADGCGLGRANELDSEKVRANHHHAGKSNAKHEEDEDRSHAGFPLPTEGLSILYSEESVAEDAAEDMGISGSHKMEVMGDTMYMPGEEHNDFVQALKDMAGRANGTNGAVEGIAKTIRSKINKLGQNNDNRDVQNDMDDEQRIDDLVNEHGFTRENVSPLSGTTCLTRIHEAVVGEGDSQDNMGDQGNDNGGDDPVFTDEQEEQIGEMIETRVNEAVEESVPDADDIADEIETPSLDDVDTDVDEEEIIEQAKEEVKEEVEEERDFERNVQVVAQSDDVPLDEEKLRDMDPDAVGDIAEEVEPEEDDSPSRSNRAGLPTGGSFDETEFGREDGEEGGHDIPAPGEKTKIGSDD